MLLHDISLVVLAGVTGGLAAATNRLQGRMRGPEPNLPFDPSTTELCEYWYDNDTGSLTCRDLLDVFGLTLTEFRELNPIVTGSCGGVVVGRAYCVQGYPDGRTLTSTSTTSSSTTSPSTQPPVTTTGVTTTTATTTTTTTPPGNGIPTPTPTQPGMTPNCDDFYLVQPGDTCLTIAAAHGLSMDNFVAWNTGVGGPSCGGLWANAYVCVSIIGHTPPPPTTTTPGNGIATPTPTQPGMVSNCDAFALVQPGDTCDVLAKANRISLDEFIAWNTGVGGRSCTGLWGNVYVCVSIVGHTPTPVQPGNGVQTPSPIQQGMTGSCKTFHLVQPGQTCTDLSRTYGISIDQIKSWNAAAGSSCTGLWGGYYACVGVL